MNKTFFFCLVLVLAPVAVAQEPIETQPAFEQLLEQAAAAGADSSVQIAAVDALGGAEGDQLAAAADALGVALKSDNVEIRWRAARSLGSLGQGVSATAVPALTVSLTDDDAKVRAYSAYALGEMGEAARPAAPELVKQAIDGDPLVRRAVFGALRRIKPGLDVTIPLFTKVLAEADPAAVMPVLQTLADGGPEAVPALREALKNEKAAYWATLVLADLGPVAAPAVPELVALLEDKEPVVRLQAILALGKIGPEAKAACPGLVKALENDKWESVQYAATYALATIGDKDSCEAAIRQAGLHGDDFQAVASAWALVQLNPNNEELKKKAVKLLVQALKNSNSHVRRAAARALFEIKASGEMIGPAIISALEDADPEVVSNAVRSIVALGPSIVDQVDEGLENDKLRMMTARILYRLGPDAADAVPELIEALEAAGDDKEDNDFREVAQFALGRIGAASAPAVEVLVDSLDSDDPEVQGSAIFALAKIGPGAQAALPALKEKLNSENRREKLLSAWAIMKIQTSDRKLLAPLAMPFLVEALTSDHEFVRIEAAKALGELGPLAATAVPALEEAATDSSSDVREAAAAAVAQIKGE
ncbi:HEAT repeat domain-containing protein [Lignipirellula cremea]|uniref:Putative lyase n=1 Tax=Lignipirellula cremea TaxID=2528010 RepID=A0A518DVQ6_9BACT|nr:HEAT repeat domain-containing protein [Lignipirellula cremea]QDU95917.1 putative lyase [Lignipirellula cremea]